MSTNKYGGVVTPENCPELKAILALNQSLIGNNSFDEDNTEPEEKLDLKKISLSKDDLIMFAGSDKPYSVTDFIQISELQGKVFTVFKDIFADVFNVQFAFDASRGGYVFIVSFRYMTNDQYKIRSDESSRPLIRTISSSIDPEEAGKTNSIAAQLMMITQQQQLNSYDASKYAKISKEAKELLTDLLFINTNNKKKWIKGSNYILTTQTGIGYNGMKTYTNIIGTVYLDAKKVMQSLCVDKDDKNKYDFIFELKSTNAVSSDALMKIELVNVTKRNQVRNKYGVSFS